MKNSISATLETLARDEMEEESRVGAAFAALNDEVFNIYGISVDGRSTIEQTLGASPSEIVISWSRGNDARRPNVL